MPIDFFKAACQDTTEAKIFGLCDDKDIYPDETPAYLEETVSTKWIAEVHNPQAKKVTFTAIDHCIENIVRANGDTDFQCDCMLTYDDSILFVELKTGGSGGWVAHGLIQLESTIHHYENNNSLHPFPAKQACISNSMRPLFSNSYRGIIQKFKDDTGFNLNIKRQIEI